MRVSNCGVWRVSGCVVGRWLCVWRVGGRVSGVWCGCGVGGVWRGVMWRECGVAVSGVCGAGWVGVWFVRGAGWCVVCGGWAVTRVAAVAARRVRWNGAQYVVCAWAVGSWCGGNRVGVFVRVVGGGGDCIVKRGARWRGVVYCFLDRRSTRAPVVASPLSLLLKEEIVDPSPISGTDVSRVVGRYNVGKRAHARRGFWARSR